MVTNSNMTTDDERISKKYIVVSYSRKDNEYKNKFVEYARKLGFEVWEDRDIELGARWFETIASSIRSCAVLLVIMTPKSLASDWVQDEILIARKCKTVTIIGLLLGGEEWDILVGFQVFDNRERILKDNLALPPLEFFREVERHVPRTPILTREEVEQFSQTGEKALKPISDLVDVPTVVSDAAYDSLSYWEKQYENGGSNDYYIILRLALAYEAVKTFRGHTEAVKYLKKATILENRILNSNWLKMHHEWLADHEDLLQKIIDDPEFAKFVVSRRR